MSEEITSWPVLRRILECEHPEEECPRLRRPSCRHALAYFKGRFPGFKPEWVPDRPQQPGLAVPTPDPAAAQAERDLEAMRGKLPAPRDWKATQAGDLSDGEVF